jgi:predicted transglutaminase-like cysteine proteinase
MKQNSNLIGVGDAAGRTEELECGPPSPLLLSCLPHRWRMRLVASMAPWLPRPRWKCVGWIGISPVCGCTLPGRCSAEHAPLLRRRTTPKCQDGRAQTQATKPLRLWRRPPKALRERILVLMREISPEALTADQIAIRIDRGPFSVRPRVSELAANGKLERVEAILQTKPLTPAKAQNPLRRGSFEQFHLAAPFCASRVPLWDSNPRPRQATFRAIFMSERQPVSGQKMRLMTVTTALIAAVGFALPAVGQERPGDPFGNHTVEIKEETTLGNIWASLQNRMHLEKAHFYECLRSKDDPCPLIPAVEKKLDEIRQYQGKALLGHLNITINLMIKPAPGGWVGPLEAITMKNGDCKSYSLAKYAAAQEVGVSVNNVRLVVVHVPARGEDHMVVAVYQDGEWFILDNLTNALLRDSEKPDYIPLAVLDDRGVRRYLSVWMQ